MYHPRSSALKFEPASGSLGELLGYGPCPRVSDLVRAGAEPLLTSSHVLLLLVQVCTLRITVLDGLLTRPACRILLPD